MFLKFTMSLILVTTMLSMSSILQGQGLGRGTVDNPIQEWPIGKPDSLGLSMEALQAHTDLCAASEASACLVAYKGMIVQEWYNEDYPADPIMMQPWIKTRSAVKSVVGLLAGMIIADGNIKGVDTPVSDFIPEWKAGADSNVTIRHLLSMTSGVARNPAGVRGPGVVAHRNTTDFVLKLPIQSSPGTRWNYSNEGAQLISPILERAAGMPLAAYAYERLFSPIGMRTSQMMVDEYYNTVTIGGTITRLREFARIGQLMLNKGSWNGSEIVSSSWIEESVKPIEQNSGYGYLWWVHGRDKAYSAAGTFDQIIYVFPELDLVTVRLQRDVGPGKTGYYWSAESRAIIKGIVPDNE